MMQLDVRVRRIKRRNIKKLVKAFGEERLLRDRLGRQQNDKGVLFAAWLGREVVGMMYLWLEQAEEKAIFDNLGNVPLLMQLEVLPDKRSCGIGRQLIAAAEDELRSRGNHKQVALAVRTDNKRAIRMYEQIDFAHWKHGIVVCNAHGTYEPEECFVMVKDLTPDMVEKPRQVLEESDQRASSVWAALTLRKPGRDDVNDQREPVGAARPN
ncbi:GNAT family N-acetyltransferase [Amycolatopsis sp. NPDC051061]|uniref:GNAT family N-acetyltransferase n=1 Tax=Amycolatopsis sp. NPDC051061 TaxID=3155042 RepID=UPI003444B365